MAKLTTKARKALPKKDFVDEKDRKFPIENKAHADNALARSIGKPEHAAVVKKVEKKYPDIRVDGKGYVHKVNHRK